MKIVELNHWFIKDNKMSISLMNLYVEIKPLIKNKKLVFSLKVINSEMNELLFLFDSLEEVFFFTENTIKNMRKLPEVAEAYSEYKNSRKEKILIKNNNKKTNL